MQQMQQLLHFFLLLILFRQLHGPLQPCVCTPDNITCRCPTSFPCPSALGTAFNDSLYFHIGKADGREARAINNLRNHVTQNVYGDGIDYWSPTLNMQRDPRWGRNQEVPGEDPELTGNYAANFVQGLQGEVDGLDSKHVQISACCKHFIANSMENWKGHTRNDFNAKVPLDDLHNYYLPAFRSCVMEGHSKGVMCSYNAVTATQGENQDPLFTNVPSCANDWLLQDTLRDGWKFDGYVTSDCGAIHNECQAEPQGHGVYNCTVATAKSIHAGTDVDCGSVYQSQIVNAVNNGLLKEEEVNDSFSRLTKQQMLLGLFDNDKDVQPYFNLGIADIDTFGHQTLAHEASQQSIVLLKNDNNLLPLQKGKNNIAIIGPHFNATELLISNYHGSRCLDPNVKGPGSGSNFDCIISPLEAIRTRNIGSNTVGSLGCDVASNDTSNIAAAVALAKEADVVILAMGIDQTQEREGLDRVITTLPGVQLELITEVLKVCQFDFKNVILVLFSGGAMSLGSVKDVIPHIISSNYGGEYGGVALADVLFGDYNPSGKLAATMYPPSYVDAIPLTEMSVTVSPGRTHMFYTGKAEFTFGSGLSYTDWELSTGTMAEEVLVLSLSNKMLRSTSMTVDVKNVGVKKGRQNVLMFWKPVGENHLVRYYQQKLISYQGTSGILNAGEKESLSFDVVLKDMSIHQDGIEGALIGDYEVFFTTGGSETTVLRRQLKVVE